MYSLFLLFCALVVVLSPFAANAVLNAAERRALRRRLHHPHRATSAEEVQG